jgi:hypothetical protein
MPTARHVEEMLKDVFDPVHTDAAVEHFQRMLEELQKRDWEQTILRSGKLVEAVLKSLWLHAGNSLPPDRDFKAGKIMDDLERLPKTAFADTIRITIPRACRFVYDVASNRGARHDPGEIDPNEMDANAVVSIASWIMAEILRYSQRGSLDPSAVASLVAGLVQKRYPFIEEVGGRVRFHLTKKSARGIGLVALWHKYPSPLCSTEVIDAIVRHGHSQKNARVALSRLRDVVDDDGEGNLRLLAPGVREAEELLAGNR